MKRKLVLGWSLLLLAFTACQPATAEVEQNEIKPKQLTENEYTLLEAITDYGVWIDLGRLDQSKQVKIGMDYYIDGERVEEGFEMTPDPNHPIQSVLIALNINGENNDQLDGIVQVNDEEGMVRTNFNRSLPVFEHMGHASLELYGEGAVVQEEKTYVGSFQIGEDITPVELEDIESMHSPGHLLAFYIKYE
ncbi:hypothetical protein MKY91_08635 [Alkalicoccobacillus gibsonii]|uniref:Uncharacterized protein n=1 Tax=Alkalicoccobacillus gibsonii TaxID=79881 RepID=A0ABU9VH28_9BACI